LITRNVLAYDYTGDIAGFLDKKSPAWLKGWQNRVIVLHNRKLRWFKLKDRDVPKVSLS